jgi:imidazolonepropionase-like amidohydrolase
MGAARRSCCGATTTSRLEAGSDVSAAQPFTLVGARIWDGVAADYLDADALAVADGRIAALGRADRLARIGEAIDASGLTVTPGLIDCHVHLCLDPTIFDPQAQSRGTDAEELAAMAARAESMLRAGITTARDLGGGRFLELALRDAIARGEALGPRLLCAGQPVTSPRGHCHFWGGEAADVDAARAVIDRQRERGVDLIKVIATGGNLTRGSKPREAQYDDATLAAIVAYARELGYRIASHCHGTAGIRASAAACVTTIEHCTWLGENGSGSDYDPEAAAALAANGIWVSPTINTGWRRFIEAGDARGPRIGANFAAMRAAGVRLIASTDAGIPNVPHADLPRALPLFARYAGLTPVESLRAATADAAAALGIGEETGTLAVGHAADLIVVEGDPLADLACLAAPRAVIGCGRWAHRAL